MSIFETEAVGGAELPKREGGSLSLAFLDWYLALFTNRFGALWKAHL
jgi:hypothetical protein